MRNVVIDGDYAVCEHETMGYAVFHRHNGFWQQVSKWYLYKAYAMRIFNARIA